MATVITLPYRTQTHPHISGLQNTPFALLKPEQFTSSSLFLNVDTVESQYVKVQPANLKAGSNNGS